MGCGASKNDVIKSASSENEPKVKGPGGGEGANGNSIVNGNVTSARVSHKANITTTSKHSSQDSLNSSNISEGSTIPASEKFGNGTTTTTGNDNGNNNDIHGGLRSSSSNRNLPELPPLKPARTSKVGFLDQDSQESTMDGGKPTPIAFEVPAEDASLIKKHPPRRLRQMEERDTDTSAVTQEALEEKVALANERRNQVLHQRVASARTKSARGGRVRRPLMDSELESSETMETGLEGNDGE